MWGIFFPPDESLNVREKVQKKVSHEILFCGVSNEIQPWFGFMAVIFDSVGQEWSHWRHLSSFNNSPFPAMPGNEHKENPKVLSYFCMLNVYLPI